jgi:TetR/AcrR family transcriptional repressor of nem operon
MPEVPRTQRGRRSRDRIVAAAAELIAERGVEGASLDQILNAARASKSQLYHYFADKCDLVRAVVASRLDVTLETQMPWLERLDSFAAIRRWFDMITAQSDAAGHPGCGIGTLASELADRDETIRNDLARCFAVWEDYLVAGLEQMRVRGDLVTNADPRRLATATFASIQGGLLLAKTRKDVEPLRIALDAAYAHLRTFRTDRSARSAKTTSRRS